MWIWYTLINIADGAFISQANAQKNRAHWSSLRTVTPTSLLMQQQWSGRRLFSLKTGKVCCLPAKWFSPFCWLHVNTDTSNSQTACEVQRKTFVCNGMQWAWLWHSGCFACHTLHKLDSSNLGVKMLSCALAEVSYFVIFYANCYKPQQHVFFACLDVNLQITQLKLPLTIPC